MRQIIKSTIFAIAVTALGACQESLEDRCTREAKTYTEKNCPVVVEKTDERSIVMDSMTFDRSTHTICYFYSLFGTIDNQQVINQGNPRQLLLMQVRNATNLKLYKEAGYSFRYVYYSTQKKGTKLFEATFHEKDYNKQ